MLIPIWFSDMIIEDNGSDNEKYVLIEEMAELMKEITKDLREKGDRQHIIEELADCYICMENCKTLYGITDRDVQTVIEDKVDRYLKRKKKGDTK